MAQVDEHMLQRLSQVEGGDEPAGRREEHLPAHLVVAAGAVGGAFAVDIEVVPDLVGEEQRGQENAGDHAEGQVVGGEDHADRHQHDQVGR